MSLSNIRDHRMKRGHLSVIIFFTKKKFITRGAAAKAATEDKGIFYVTLVPYQSHLNVFLPQNIFFCCLEGLSFMIKLLKSWSPICVVCWQTKVFVCEKNFITLITVRGLFSTVCYLVNNKMTIHDETFITLITF